jgi:hypothetical protein
MMSPDELPGVSMPVFPDTSFLIDEVPSV